MKITPAQVTLNALRDGQVMNEMAQAIQHAMDNVNEFRKPAEINLCITIRPLGTEGVSDAVEIIGDVQEKLFKPKPPSTLFFRDADGAPSRQRDRQPEIPGLSIAGAVKPSSAA